MKVCHLISGDLWAGAEVQTCTLLCSLRESVDVSAIILNEGTLAERLRRADIDTHVIPETSNSFFALKRQVAEKLRDIRPDILHTHRYKENILGAALKHTSGHLVQTVHGLREGFSGIRRLRMSLYLWLNEYYTRRRFSRIIAVSEEIEKHLAGLYGQQRVVAIHNAIAVDDQQPSKNPSDVKRELGLRPDQIVIGSVGRLVPVKAFDIFLRAARLISEKLPDAAFVIAGDGPLMSSLAVLSRDLGIDDRVVLTGFRDDILNLMNTFDIYVISSHHEGIPISALEAMAMKKALVSTRVGGMPEIIDDSHSGLLVEPGNANAIADGCVRILNDPKLRADIENGARSRVEEEFSVAIQRERIVNLYTELMS